MDYDNDNEGNYDEEESKTVSHTKKSNILPLWGNERTMNLNALILTNIQSSHYFKVNLYELKTYHEVIDEIYYKVSHLEPWEKGSRKTAGQTGMCGGVRGVGAGGIVSTAYCLLYKLFTLKLTRKQVNGLITHPDSPYIRALGFMYIRYTQPPADLWDWYDEYLEDTEELDVKAGGGQIMTMGNILKNFLCKLEWFSTLFPRIPVPIQQKLEKMMNERFPPSAPGAAVAAQRKPLPADNADRQRGVDMDRDRKSEQDRRGGSLNNDRGRFSRERDRDRDRPVSRDRDRTRDTERRRPSRDRDVSRRPSRDRLERDRDMDMRDRRERDDRDRRERDDRDRRDRDDRDRLDRNRDRDFQRDNDRDKSRRISPVRRRDVPDSRYRRDRESPRRNEHDDRHRRDRDRLSHRR